MRIAFVVNQMNSGGAQRVVANLSTEFILLGHDVSIIMINETKEYSYYPLEREVRLVPISKIYRNLSALKKITFISNSLKMISPDIVLSFIHHVNIYTHFAAVKNRIPNIVAERTDPAAFPRGRVMRLLRNYAYRHADGCVFQTAHAKDFFSPLIQAHSTVIPNPVVLTYEPKEPPARERNIIAAGRLVPQKNYDMLIEAFRLFSFYHPDFSLTICGEGNLRNNIESLVKDLGLVGKVILMGQVENPHYMIYNSSIFALSSDHEGMPNALLEAMALGVPSVATDCPSGGPAEIILNNINGILVPVGDATAMADAFRRIVNDNNLAAMLSDNAIQVRDIYSISEVAKKWLDYICLIIDGYSK